MLDKNQKTPQRIYAKEGDVSMNEYAFKEKEKTDFHDQVLEIYLC